MLFSNLRDEVWAAADNLVDSENSAADDGRLDDARKYNEAGYHLNLVHIGLGQRPEAAHAEYLREMARKLRDKGTPGRVWAAETLEDILTYAEEQDIPA